MAEQMKLVVAGAGGRMGRILMNAVSAHSALALHGAIDRSGSPTIGETVNGVTVTDDAAGALKGADGLIDFTAPKASLGNAGLCAERGLVHIIGTTGFSSGEEKKLQAVTKGARVVKAGNFSLGVNVLLGLTRQAAKALGPAFDVEISEMHHRHKVDSPSGTALMLGEAAAGGRGQDLGKSSVRGRDGIHGPRKDGDIGFTSLRGGDVIGEHTVIFAGPSERIELTHKAEDRSLFASGALTAALWAKDQPPGFYAMTDVLGL